MEFKFFQKPISIQPTGNMYLMFNMDDALINVIRWKQHRDIEMLNSDAYLQDVNVPINGYLRILYWRTSANTTADTIEIDYRIIETNTTPTNFTLRMDLNEFVRRIDIRGI